MTIINSKDALLSPLCNVYCHWKFESTTPPHPTSPRPPLPPNTPSTQGKSVATEWSYSAKVNPNVVTTVEQNVFLPQIFKKSDSLLNTHSTVELWRNLGKNEVERAGRYYYYCELPGDVLKKKNCENEMI